MILDKKYIFLIIISIIIIAIDQATKIYFHTQFELGQSQTIIKNFFDFTYVRNTGVAFGFMQDWPEMYRKILLLTIPPFVAFLIAMLIKGAESDDQWQVFSLSLIFAGDLGNFTDRIMYGYVVDFLDFYIGPRHWPAFNVADMAIVIGVTSMFVWTWFSPYSKDTKNKAKA